MEKNMPARTIRVVLRPCVSCKGLRCLCRGGRHRSAVSNLAATGKGIIQNCMAVNHNSGLGSAALVSPHLCTGKGFLALFLLDSTYSAVPFTKQRRTS